MSYGLGIAGDARADLRAMDVWLQEEFWDELERIAADSSLIVEGADDLFHSFTRVHAGQKHYVMMTIARNDQSRIVTVLGITHRQSASP